MTAIELIRSSTWRRREHLAPAQRTATAPTPARFSTARSPYGFELNIRPDRATLYRPDPQDARRKLMYDYRGGWGDPYSTTTVDTGDRVVDLSKFNFEQTIAVLRGAPETMKIQPKDISDTWIDIEPSQDPATPEAVNVRIYISSEFGSGFIDLAPDGSVKQINEPS